MPQLSSLTAPAGTSDKAALLRARYGHPDVAAHGPSNSVIELLLAHRSVRKFKHEVVGDDVVSTIVSAAQSAPTGLNFQNWSVIHVKDREKLARLAVLADNQPFICDASIVLFFVADWARAVSIASWNNVTPDGVGFLDSTFTAVTDATLAAQNASIAAESLGFGTCFLGAIRNNLAEVSEELGLPDHTFPLFGLIIGRPDPEDKASVKPRLPQEVVLHTDTYQAAEPTGIAAFEERIGRYYAGQGNPHSWIATVLRRMGGKALNGRERIYDILIKRGLARR